MKKLLIFFIMITSCNNQSNKVDSKHIESLAEKFMKNTVIPTMRDPKPFEVENAVVVTRTVADNINDYRFVYDHLSFNKNDSVINKMRLDSIIRVSSHPDSVISITVNVSYKTKYKRGDVTTDSIKLAYDQANDKVTFWPF